MSKDNYLEVFQSESLSLLEYISANLVDLEKKPGDQAIINKLFRYMHTLKGSASLDELDKISVLAHHMENIFGAVRDSGAKLPASTIDLTFEVVDMLTDLVKFAGTDRYKRINVSDITAKLEEIIHQEVEKSPETEMMETVAERKIGSAELNQIESFLEKGDKAYRILLKYNSNDRMKGVMSLIVFNNLKGKGVFVKSFPPIEELQNPDSAFAEVEILYVTSLSFVDIKNIVKTNCQIFQLSRLDKDNIIELYVDRASQSETGELEFKLLPIEIGDILKRELSGGKRVIRIVLRFAEDDLMKAVNAFIIINNLRSSVYYLYSEPNAVNFQKMGFQFRKVDIFVSCDCPWEIIEQIISANCHDYELGELDASQVDELSGLSGEHTKDKPVELPIVEVDKVIVDGVIENIGELILNINVAIQMMDEALSLPLSEKPEKNDLEQLHQKFLEAYDQVRSTAMFTYALMDYAVLLRLVPIRHLFNKFPRIVRDAARAAGKQVDLVIEGERTRLGQEILEHLEAALLHMIRNAIDHGIESAKERKAKKKPPSGTIKLKAYQVQNKVYVEVGDDGAGLNREAILRKATEKGLIKPEEVADMKDSEVYKLIFQPGFSTSAQVTALSGRGVGMDVVMECLKEIHGDIKISTEKDNGTVFTLIMPLAI